MARFDEAARVQELRHCTDAMEDTPTLRQDLKRMRSRHQRCRVRALLTRIRYALDAEGGA